MAEDTLECANCGNANPAWAQVCRSCGAPLTAAAVAAAAESAVVTQGSLMAIGAALGTIALAVLIGLVLGGILPPAPPVAAATPTPNPSASAEPTAEPTLDPSGGSPDPSASVGPILPGILTFGLGLNVDTQRVTNPTDTFTPGTTFAHSIELTAPFGVTQLGEEVARINEDGSETIVITTENQVDLQDANATVDGFTVPTNALLDALGAGTYVMRVYRGTELLAQGTFILAE
jgi:hypothetical protein